MRKSRVRADAEHANRLAATEIAIEVIGIS
jgi:hypothetical protein